MWYPTTYGITKTTIELRDIVENSLENSQNIWDFEYPSFYEGAEKAAFEQKVIDHYYFRQIGQETVGRFLHCFRTKVREIMPYYIQLYNSVKIMEAIEDPFGNVDIVESWTETRGGTTTDVSESTATSETTATSDGNSTTTRKHSDTPQGSIKNLETHLSDATIESSEGGSSNASEASSTANGENVQTRSETITHDYTKKGNQGVNTFAHDIKELRETYLNIDMLIIEELGDLFLKIF